MSRLLVDPAMLNGAKFAGATDHAKLLHFLGLCYAASALTDGFVPEVIARKLTHADRKTFDRSMAHLSSVQPGCDHPSWESRLGGWFLHDYDDPIYGNPLREDLEKRREQKVKAGAEGGKKSALARLEKYGTAQPPSSKPEAQPEAPASKHPEAPASTSASESPTPPAEADPKLAHAGAQAGIRALSLPFPSLPLVTDTHGDVVKVGVNGRPTDTPRLPTDLKGWSDWDQLSESARVGRVMDFLPAKRGDHQTLDAEKYQHELSVSKQVVSLALVGPVLKKHLNVWWDESDPDDRPSSLEYFWTRMQQLENEGLKQQSRPHARTSGLSRISESLPTTPSSKP